MNRIKWMPRPVLAAVLAVAGALAVQGAWAADDPVVVGFIGSFASDTGKSTLRGAEIAIDELNEAGGGARGADDRAGLGPTPART